MEKARMEEETREEIYREIMRRYFMKFDMFFMERWCDVPRTKLIGEETRKRAFKKFYDRVKNSEVASKITMQKWFGIRGEKKPTRSQLLKVAFALKMDAEELNEHLLKGISEPELQVNDYREFIAMYCLDHGISYRDYDKMLCFFEERYEEEIEFRHTAHTNELKQFYEELRDKSKEEFLLWTCQHMELFKGYSRVTYDYFTDLMNEVYHCIREKLKNDMYTLLLDIGFVNWAKKEGIGEERYAEEIQRYVKNEIRRSRISEERKKDLNEVRYYASIVYSSRSYMKQVLVELCRKVREETVLDMDFEFLELKKELKKMDAAYISNLLNIAEQKEENLKLSKAGRESEGEEAEKIKKKIMHQNQRVKQIQRKDLLIPAQYIAQRKYQKEHGEEYDREEAKKAFVEYADTILDTCGMRKINPEYELDYILLQCYGEQEMGLFAEVFEE